MVGLEQGLALVELEAPRGIVVLRGLLVAVAVDRRLRIQPLENHRSAWA